MRCGILANSSMCSALLAHLPAYLPSKTPASSPNTCVVWISCILPFPPSLTRNTPQGSPEAPRCGFSRKVVEALQSAGEPFGSFDILTDEAVRQGLKEYSSWPTYPQVRRAACSL